jgi:hypothetical protein
MPVVDVTKNTLSLPVLAVANPSCRTILDILKKASEAVALLELDMPKAIGGFDKLRSQVLTSGRANNISSSALDITRRPSNGQIKELALFSNFSTAIEALSRQGANYKKETGLASIDLAFRSLVMAADSITRLRFIAELSEKNN